MARDRGPTDRVSSQPTLSQRTPCASIMRLDHALGSAVEPLNRLVVAR